MSRKSECSCDCDNRECFAHESGECHALKDTDFGGKPCPFFKTREQIDREEHKRQLREELANL